MRGSDTGREDALEYAARAPPRHPRPSPRRSEPRSHPTDHPSSPPRGDRGKRLMPPRVRRLESRAVPGFLRRSVALSSWGSRRYDSAMASGGARLARCRVLISVGGAIVGTVIEWSAISALIPPSKATFRVADVSLSATWGPPPPLAEGAGGPFPPGGVRGPDGRHAVVRADVGSDRRGRVRRCWARGHTPVPARSRPDQCRTTPNHRGPGRGSGDLVGRLPVEQSAHDRLPVVSLGDHGYDGRAHTEGLDIRWSCSGWQEESLTIEEFDPPA